MSTLIFYFLTYSWKSIGGITNQETCLSDGSISYGPIEHTGMYSVSWTGQATPIDTADGATARRRIACNLLDPFESDVGTSPTLTIARDVIQAQTERESDLTRKLWPYLLLAALAVVMFEWFIYNRKVAL